MARRALGGFLIALAILGAASAQTVVRAPARTDPVIATEPVPATSLQSDVTQLSARVATLEAGNAQLADRLAALNDQLVALEEAYGNHRHSFGDNTVGWENLTVANQQVSHITGNLAAHDVTGPPHQ